MTFEITSYSETQQPDLLKFKLLADDGQYLEILNYGGIVHSWFCKDKDGQLDDILLGKKQPIDYFESHPYFGAVVGRYANRIGHGKIEIEGKSYVLNTNLPPHHLHGGISGFDKKIYSHWIETQKDKIMLKLTSYSSCMEEGFPGNLNFSVIYTYHNDNKLNIRFEAITDKTTHVNMTNHCYFNLGGQRCQDVLDHEVRIQAEKITETDKSLLPTGKFILIENTPFDLRKSVKLGDVIFDQNINIQMAKGFDHNYVLNPTDSTREVAEAFHPESGRHLKVSTDQPGLQFYTGNWLKGIQGKNGIYEDYAGFCLEAQHFPDSPNRPEFPTTLLRPGEKYVGNIIYDIFCQGTT